MKRIFLGLTGLCMLGCAQTFALSAPPTAAKEDTIVITMPDKSKMLIYVKDKEDLKKFRNYNVDSLIASLSLYLSEQPTPGADTTLIVKSRGPKGARSNEVIVSVSGGDSPEVAALNRASKTLAQNMEMIDRHIAMIDKQRTLPGITAQDQQELNREKQNLQREKENLAKEKDALDSQIAQLRKTDGSGKKQSWKVSVSDEKIEVSAKDKEVKKPETKSPPKPWFSEYYIDLGFNTLTNKANFVNPAGEQIPVDLRPFGSRYVSLNWVTGSRIGGAGSPFRIQTGLQFNFNNFMFDNNMRIANLDNQVVFYKEEEMNLSKSKLAITYLTLPVMFGIKPKNKEGKNGITFLAGGYAGYRIGSHTKIKYTDSDGDTRKSKSRNSYNLEDYQYGVSASIGYRGLQLFTKYNLSDMFKDNRGPQAQIVSFGITI